jgi:hypothetical protein
MRQPDCAELTALCRSLGDFPIRKLDEGTAAAGRLYRVLVGLGGIITT